MRIVRIVFAALAVSFALASCKPAANSNAGAGDTLTPKLAELDKQANGLRTEAFKLSGGKQADLNAIVAALPKGWSLSWEKMDFDAASGATILTNAKASNTEAPGFGIAASEVRLWGLDAGLLAARLQGQRLSDAGPVLRRIDAKGVSVTGIDKLMKPYMDAMASGFGETMSFDRYDIGASRVIVDNVALLPWLDKPADPAKAQDGEEMAKLFAAIRAYGAMMNAVSYSAYVVDGVTGAIDYTAGGESFKGKLAMVNAAARNVNGADMELAVARDIKFDAAIESKPYGATEAARTDVSMSLGLESLENMRLAKASKYLVDLKAPPRTETDLLSLGVFHMRDMKLAENGLDLYSVKDITFDGSGFYWLVPTRMRVELKDLTTYNHNMLLASYETMKRTAKASGEAEPPKEAFIPPEMEAAMKKYEFDVTKGGGAFGWSWDPKTGAAKVDATAAAEKLARAEFHFDGLLPTFDEVSKLLPEDQIPTEEQMDAVSKVFNEKVALKGASLDVYDDGVLTRGFAFFNEIETTRNKSPDQKTESVDMLRANMANGFRTEASTAKENKKPRTSAGMEAVAAFIEKGAPIHFLLSPAAPVILAEMEKIQGEEDALEKLNFTVKK